MATISQLSKHIKKLQETEGKKPIARQTKEVILFWGDPADKPYLAHLKSCVGAHTVFLRLEAVTTVTQVKMYCSSKGITKIVSSSISFLNKLLAWDKRKAPSLSNYAGSYFTIPTLEDDGEIEIVFIQPLKQLVTVTYGKFMAKRIISKLIKPDSWFAATKFNFSILECPREMDKAFNIMLGSFLIAVDIETFKEDAVIRCIAYTGFYYNIDGGIESYSYVLPLDSEYNLAIMRKWNWELKAPKVLQNGKYDCSYLARYSAPLYNYLYDTANMFHSWYSELPKDLGFLNSFFIREAMYWKDLSETTDLYEYYKYNALDTWGTGNALLAMLLELPDWAIQNYLLEFPKVFPCHMAEMRGIERDMDALGAARKKAETIAAEKNAKLDKMLGVTGFNVKSPPQMKALLKILGCGDLKSADEKNLKKAMFRHPLNTLILELVLDVREARTRIEKYLQTGEKAKEFHRQDGTGNRILFSLNPHGTDSSRLASKEHHFWCGLQIQNIPRGPEVKCTLRADSGFYIAEVDLEQAESRDTAYISGEEAMIQAVEYSPDFHSQNASSFFGVPFDQIFDVVTGKKLDKALRDIAKNVNHGANYNMGPLVLIETMGLEKIARAKKLLKLPRFWTFMQVAEYLLAGFHKTYPGLEGTYYPGVVSEILETRRLKHHLYDSTTGKELNEVWTRYCFGQPDKNKRHLNSYIAHPPQALNAQTLNKAWMRVYTDIAMNPEYAEHFKLIAQIHDSILFQYRIGHDYLCDMVKERMEIPVTVRGYDGKIRTFTVPAGVKKGIDGKIATFWSETE